MSYTPRRRTQALRRVPLQLPPMISLHSPTGWEERGIINVLPAGKAPKLRFAPGSFVRCRDGKLYEVACVYRIQDMPTEWLYRCNERQSLTPEPEDSLLCAINALGAGSKTPRIVRQIFVDGFQAHTYFADIPVGRNCTTFTNRQLLQRGAQTISSGQVLEPRPGAID